MWIERSISPRIYAASAEYPCVLLTGPRRAGKTSLLRRLFPDHAYVSLDAPSAAEQAEKDPGLFLETLGEPAIIDEIQYAPSLFRSLKPVLDAAKRKGRFLLTGSQDFRVMEGVSESLAGRCAILRLATLSAAEIRRAFPEADEFEVMLRGGFPELWADGVSDLDLWYSSYVSTYVERDVRNILNVSSLRDFERLLRALAARSGGALSYSDLARDVGVAVSTARAWVGVLAASDQVWLLEPYFRNLGKRVVKTPKAYLSDVGLASYLNGIRTRDQLLDSPALGALWETFAVGEIRRRQLARSARSELWYWRNRSGAEVDCVIDRGRKFWLYEAKFAERLDAAALSGVRAFQKMYGEDAVARALVLSRAPRRHTISEDAQAVHLLRLRDSDFPE